MDTQRFIAFIPSAGLGKRLKVETETVPKALVHLHDKPMIYWILKKLSSSGIRDFVINVHHHAEKMIVWLTEYQNSNSDIRIHISLEKEKLLDTGGALKNVRHILENFSHILVHNVDIFSNLDLSAFMQKSLTRSCDVLLLVSDRQTSRYLLFDQSMRLSGWENRKTHERILTGKEKNTLKPLAFSGIYTINPELLREFPTEDIFSVIPWFLHLSENHDIYGLQHDVTHWYDAGKPPSLKVLREMAYDDFKQLTESK